MAENETTTTTRQPTEKQVKILETKNAHPDLSTREIAAICDTGHSHVVQTLQRYGIQQQDVKDYKQHRADILAGLQSRLLISVTDEEIKKASLLQRLSAYGIIYDKERLERGQSTANVQSLSLVVDAARARREARLKSQVSTGNLDQSDAHAHNDTDNTVDAEVI